MLIRMKFEIDQLVNEMLDKFPEEVWTNPNTTFLDPSAAGGQFLKEVEKKLISYGHKNISERVFGFFDSELELNYAKNKHSLNSRLFVSDINTIKEVMKEELNDMKFDVIVGNPPYQSASGPQNTKLWKKFLDLNVNLSTSIIAYISPDTALTECSKNGVAARKTLNDNGFNFIEAKVLDKNTFKGVGINPCYWICSKNSSNIIDPILIKKEERPKIIDDILNKIINDNIETLSLVWEENNGYIKRKDLHNNGSNKIYFSGDKVSFTDKEVISKGLKIVFPFSSSYHKAFITEEPIGMLNLCFYHNNMNEAKNILHYSQLKLFKFAALHYKKTSGFTPFIKNSKLPMLDFSKRWTDQELYEYFNLTQEEVDYIEENA